MTAAPLPLTALPCRICGQPAPRQLSARGDRSGESITVYSCGACNAHFTAPPDFDCEIQDEGLIAYYEAHRDYILWPHNRIFDSLERVFGLARGRFLDVGSGAGYSLEVAAKRGWDAQGIEPDCTLARYSQDRMDGNLIHGYFTPEMSTIVLAGKPPGCDYLLVDNVLEHVDDPVGSMEQGLGLLAERSNPLVAATPVDWLRGMLGRNPLARASSCLAQINLFYDPEQYANYFARRAMRRLIEEWLCCTLLLNSFHHSLILDSPLALFCGYETGYFFTMRSAGEG